MYTDISNIRLNISNSKTIILIAAHGDSASQPSTENEIFAYLNFSISCLKLRAKVKCFCFSLLN